MLTIMTYRIFVDESGTHEANWLIIGMLFVPNHGLLHSKLCSVKDALGYTNGSPRISAKYKEVHLAKFKSRRDVEVAKQWIDKFLECDCFYRSVVVDWSIWNGKYFGDPFESDALKKRRAYKKWAEMLLQPEVSKGNIRHAELYLDKLRMVQSYDVLDHLKDRFTGAYEGKSPYIIKFRHTDSFRDANQCLQLCDLLTGCLYRALVPSTNSEKQATKEYLEQQLIPIGVKHLGAAFWKQYASNSLTKHMPKFSAWFWRPTD